MDDRTQARSFANAALKAVQERSSYAAFKRAHPERCELYCQNPDFASAVIGSLGRMGSSTLVDGIQEVANFLRSEGRSEGANAGVARAAAFVKHGRLSRWEDRGGNASGGAPAGP